MNYHLTKSRQSDITAVNPLPSKSNGSSQTEERVALHRLWLAAISFLSMTAAGVLLARELPGYIFALLAAAMIPHLWLFSLHIVGAPLPARLVRLNIVALAGSVFSAVTGPFCVRSVFRRPPAPQELCDDSKVLTSSQRFR
jgi:hypothetical protein